MERIRTILLNAIYPALISLFLSFYVDCNGYSKIENKEIWGLLLKIIFLIFILVFIVGVYAEIENYKKNKNKNC